MKKAPNDIAVEIGAIVGENEPTWRVEAVQAYVNIFLNRGQSVADVTREVLARGNSFGDQDIGRGERVVIDFSSPNIAKPFHIGHLRSTIIGHSLHRIFQKLGYETVRINHLGDWGTQFGKLIVGYRKWGNDEALSNEPIQEMHRLYVLFHEEAEKHPELEEEARIAFKALEEGGAAELELWKRFRDLSLVEFNRIYNRLDVGFDSDKGESAYNDMMQLVIDELSEKGLLEESDGAHVVKLDDMPPCLIQKRDGATLYATRDLAAAINRHEEYRFKHLFYVVGMPQELHFRQFFSVLEKMERPWVNCLEHIGFGHIRLAGAQLSTRRGHVIYLDELLDQAVTRVKAIIGERNPDLENADEVAEIVGVGAITFNDLFHNRSKDISFDWDSALNFEGDTGPYVQYTYARAASLLRRADKSEKDFERVHIDSGAFPDHESFLVAKQLAQFPEIVKFAAEAREPSMIARYVVSLCQLFNGFYHAKRIIGEPYEMERLALTFAVRHVIKNSLFLLGMKAPDAM